MLFKTKNVRQLLASCRFVLVCNALGDSANAVEASELTLLLIFRALVYVAKG
ncbi:MAG: hypothetical protein RIS47_639 [Bacteroidota bacterium]